MATTALGVLAQGGAGVVLRPLERGNHLGWIVKASMDCIQRSETWIRLMIYIKDGMDGNKDMLGTEGAQWLDY